MKEAETRKGIKGKGGKTKERGREGEEDGGRREGK